MTLPGKGLGKQSRFVVLTLVFQLFQLFCQPFGIPRIITGGHQGGESCPKRFASRYRQIRLTNKACSAEHLPFHPQKLQTAVFPGQFRNCQAGFRFICLKHAHRHSAAGSAFQSQIPSVPVDFHSAGHGRAGPGRIVLLIRQTGFGGLCPGIQAVEHGQKKGAPGALSPLVFTGNHVEPRFQGQRLMLQLSEGGRHGIYDHGSSTSSPSRILRDSSAARRMVSASWGSACSKAPWRRSKKTPWKLSSPMQSHSSRLGLVRFRNSR